MWETAAARRSGVQERATSAATPSVPVSAARRYEFFPNVDGQFQPINAAQRGFDGEIADELDALYDVASPAHTIFEATMNLFLARCRKNPDDARLRAAVRGATFTCAPLKDREKTRSKARAYGGRAGRVYDVVRGELVCDDEASLAALCDAMDADDTIVIARARRPSHPFAAPSRYPSDRGSAPSRRRRGAVAASVGYRGSASVRGVRPIADRRRRPRRACRHADARRHRRRSHI